MALLAIIGAGGHGHDLADIAYQCGHEVAFYDDGPNPYVPTRHAEGLEYVVGVNNPHQRKALAVGPTSARLIHPTATISGTARLHEGVVVGAGATVGPDTILGPHVHVGPGCTITRTKVGAFTTIAPGVDIAGDVTIGEEVMVGLGAKVSNLLTIGARAVIGCGSVVVRNIEADEIVAGVPAKPLPQRKGATT